MNIFQELAEITEIFATDEISVIELKIYQRKINNYCIVNRVSTRPCPPKPFLRDRYEIPSSKRYFQVREIISYSNKSVSDYLVGPVA